MRHGSARRHLLSQLPRQRHRAGRHEPDQQLQGLTPYRPRGITNRFIVLKHFVLSPRILKHSSLNHSGVSKMATVSRSTLPACRSCRSYWRRARSCLPVGHVRCVLACNGTPRLAAATWQRLRSACARCFARRFPFHIVASRGTSTTGSVLQPWFSPLREHRQNNFPGLFAPFLTHASGTSRHLPPRLCCHSSAAASASKYS